MGHSSTLLSIAALCTMLGAAAAADTGTTRRYNLPENRKYHAGDEPVEYRQRTTNYKTLYVVLGCTGALALLVIAGTLFQRWRSKQPKVATAIVECGNCKNKILYPLTFAGKKSKCPRCKQAIMYPFDPKSLPKGYPPSLAKGVRK